MVVIIYQMVIRHSDEERRQDGEHVGLDVSHQQFQASHEDGHEDGYDGYHAAHACAIHATDDENQGHEHHDDDVTGKDVGEQTDHQGERLGDGGD